MAINLKSFYDGVKAANEKVMRIAEKIQAAFDSGTDEGKAEALGMRVELDTAQSDAKAALELYNSMKAAAQTGDFADRFAPAGGQDQAKKTLTRAAYEALSFQARHDFAVNGGTIEEEE